jgi:hypothetical protein
MLGRVLIMLSNSFWVGFVVGACLVFTAFFVYFIANRAARERAHKK